MLQIKSRRNLSFLKNKASIVRNNNSHRFICSNHVTVLSTKSMSNMSRSDKEKKSSPEKNSGYIPTSLPLLNPMFSDLSRPTTDTNHMFQSPDVNWNNTVLNSANEAKREATLLLSSSSVPTLGIESCSKYSAQQRNSKIVDELEESNGQAENESLFRVKSLLLNPIEALKVKNREQVEIIRTLLKLAEGNERLVQLILRARIVGRKNDKRDMDDHPSSPSKIWNSMKEVPARTVESEMKKIEKFRTGMKRKCTSGGSLVPPKVYRKCNTICNFSSFLENISPTKLGNKRYKCDDEIDDVLIEAASAITCNDHKNEMEVRDTVIIT